ncbi:hypothetical protein JW824_01460 [bacterium]|nr:hypothetical protein [bacterium]RQV98568.1 MAG: hypothetical protein EH221_01850 [bacterium]
MDYQVHFVKNNKDLKAFIRLPYWLYKHINDKTWVPPLLIEEKKKYSKTNPSLTHCDYQFFLLLKNGKPVGRICAFIHRHAVKQWKTPVGFFGSYECLDDREGSKRLLGEVRKWLRDRDMICMRGPWDFDTKEYGFVVKGYDQQPMMMAPYNPPYYNDQMEAFGLKKVKDLLAYELDLTDGYHLPSRFLKLTDRIAKRNRINIRSINMKKLENDVNILLKVANVSTYSNWGYVEVTDAEASAIAQSMKHIADPDIVMIAEIDSKPIGYLIALPDINILIKKMNGRLLPFGFIQLLIGRKNIRQYRIWALGIIPGYQRRAIDTLFYRRLYEIIIPKNPQRLEANYVLENNLAMSNPIQKLGFKESKRYRVYEMSI